jgi:adenylate cyclase
MAASQAKICKGCWEQLHLPIPLRGVISVPFRAVGIRPSRMSPDLCTICETMFERMMKARQISIDATVLFADLRGYTTLSQAQSPDAISQVLDAFYDDAAEAVWTHEGLVIKTMGDAVLALFNFPLRREDHVKQAVMAARDLQENWAARWETLKAGLSGECDGVGIGIGIDCGEVSFGEFGRTHHDLTAIGTVVNRATRAQAAAAAGEILVTQAAQERCGLAIGTGSSREVVLKGFEQPTRLWAA